MQRTAAVLALSFGACAPLTEVESASSTAPAPSKRVELEGLADLEPRFDSYFAGRVGRRVHIQTDKPLYQPGETIWIKTWDLKARDLTGVSGATNVMYELVNPKGSVVLRKTVRATDGLATNDFVIPASAEGGPYKVRVRSSAGSFERPVVVSTYEAPRIKKKLELLRKTYGPGDRVTATIEVKRPTGQPLNDQPLRGELWLDGAAVTSVQVKTDAAGAALIRFDLPKKIDRGDARLTVMVEDGGITESVSKRIPIVLKKIQLALFPEGGQLVEGLPSRLYFEAKTPLGKPADVEGRIVDDLGNPVAHLSTYHFGLGRVAFTPATGRTYRVEISKPVGVTEKFRVPVAASSGCVLKAYDDNEGERPEIRVAVRCTDERRVAVIATMRERLIDSAAVEVLEGRPATIYLASGDDRLDRARGVARLTLFDDQLRPLAERLVFRNRAKGLNVRLETDQPRYMPRDQVAVTVRTSDDEGQPVPAEIALSVVDDTVVSFADDKTGHMLAKMLLEPEIPGKLEEPNFFFDETEEKSAATLELLMGTRGWRKFDWRPILTPPPNASVVAKTAIREEQRPERARRRRQIGRAMPRPRPLNQLPAPLPATPPAPQKKRAPEPLGAEEAEAAEAEGDFMDRDAEPARLRADRPARGRAGGELDADFGPRDEMRLGRVPRLTPVRVFPAPVYDGPFEGPRTDFRETIHWAPSVKTDRSGKAVVTFYLSDAITSFRIFAEARGAGRLGRAESVFESSLPFSMGVKLPLEVSANDRILLPLTLSNDRDHEVSVDVKAEFGSLLRIDDEDLRSEIAIGAKERRSIFYPVSVTSGRGESEVSFAASSGGLEDEFVRKVRVVPLGFPIGVAHSGSVERSAEFNFDMGEPIEGSLRGKLTVYPSPVSTLLSGIDGMLREPYGCFEQTSSSNYPNVMIMQYMESTDSVDPAIARRAAALMDKGYKRLVGFEAKGKGYEWFGRSPAHEALTAYGLLEFADMKRVYPGVDDAMVRRTAAWLKTRRDGKGGFLRDAKALDSFGRADPDITDMYIVHALVEAGYRDFPDEIAKQAEVTAQTHDPYLLALGTRMLFKLGDTRRAQTAAKRLVSLQRGDGHWVAARHSITRSRGHNLAVETTALSVLALLATDAHPAAVRRGVEWLVAQRRGAGAFGATQATVLALKALTAYAIDARHTLSDGVLTLEINGQSAGRLRYDKGRREPMAFTGLGRYLRSSDNTVRVRHDGRGALPFSFSVDYRATQPANHPDAAVRLDTDLERTQLEMGQTVRATATVRNVTDGGLPMTLVRVGLPGGLTYQTWQLKELIDKGTIAFYETRAREIVLYLRDMKPAETRRLPLDLVASVPGDYTGPASQAYLYYTDDQKHWTTPLKIRIRP